MTIIVCVASHTYTLEHYNMPRQNKDFDLQGLDEYSDEYAIQIAIHAARRFLKVDDITPKQIISIGRALNALQRMPKCTPWVHVEFGLCLDTPNELQYLSFFITEDVFQIKHGGAIDRGAGYDSYSLPGWHIETSGYREAEAPLWEIEDYIETYLQDGAEVSVDDEF